MKIKMKYKDKTVDLNTTRGHAVYLSAWLATIKKKPKNPAYWWCYYMAYYNKKGPTKEAVKKSKDFQKSAGLNYKWE